MIICKNLFNKIISPDNLFLSWEKFKKGKQDKQDVMKFEYRLEQNIFDLHRDLKEIGYRHGPYESFFITDPKRRHIHKATVRDRVLHHAIYSQLYPLFNPIFIPTSFSCRIGKGNHKGVLWLEKIVRKVSRNYTKPCFILRCDIRKFFDSVDHNVLIDILKKNIKDDQATWLLKEVIYSFLSRRSNLFNRMGLPIGNLTSQIFANIYMNKFDQFIKQKLRVKYYARYTDDFVIVFNNKEYLEDILEPISNFLGKNLKLELHSNKVSIHKLHNGIDFLGYITLPHYKLLRTKTKKRIFKGLKQKMQGYRAGKVSDKTAEQSLQSYLGVLSHASCYRVSEELKNLFWFLK